MKAHYSLDSVLLAYRELGLSHGQTVFVESDFASLGLFECHDAAHICAAHYDGIRSAIGEEGTLVVPTTTNSLSHSKKPFDPLETPSEWGMFSEYVRRLEGAVRSFHPFTSFAAVGPDAERICSNVSRHAYGPRTPFARMIERDATFISVGIKPRLTPTTVHQVEMDIGVPYRYVKEVMHPVIRGGEMSNEYFYRHVWYYACDIEKDINEKLWPIFESSFPVAEASVGRGKLYAYSMRSFYNCAVEALSDDVYLLLKSPPNDRPYQGDM